MRRRLFVLESRPRRSSAPLLSPVATLPMHLAAATLPMVLAVVTLPVSPVLAASSSPAASPAAPTADPPICGQEGPWSCPCEGRTLSWSGLVTSKGQARFDLDLAPCEQLTAVVYTAATNSRIGAAVTYGYVNPSGQEFDSLNRATYDPVTVTSYNWAQLQLEPRSRLRGPSRRAHHPPPVPGSSPGRPPALSRCHPRSSPAITRTPTP